MFAAHQDRRKPVLGVWLATWMAIAVTVAGSPKADAFVLVEDGENTAPIVVFEDAPRFTRIVADELADYIEKISGARPEIIEGEPEELPERAIWVAYQPVLDSLFPEQDFEFEHAEEILIAANEDHLVITGRDRWDPGHMVLETSRGNVEGVQQEYGTVNAVYTFIQDYLDVRWLWPGELGTDIIKRETISFEPFKQRYHPQFRSRRGLFARYRLGRWGFDPGREPQTWVRKHRLLLDSLAPPAGHDFNDWWKRFHEDHPEYFALQPDGTRSESYRNKRNVKLCHSNPDVWQQWLKDVEHRREEDPTRTVFGASPGDGYNSGHCICDDCRAWDHLDAPQYTFTWEGLSQKYVSMTDRHMRFANEVARLLRDRYPDEDYFVGMTAYGNWRSAPIDVTLDDNIVIRAVFNFHNRPGGEHRELFRQWSEAAPNILWKPNLGPGSPQIGYPLVAPRRAIDDLRFAAEHHAVGLFFDMIWYNWAVQGPHYYMLARMEWNPYADGEAVLEDYYQRAFGEAVEPMKAYWALMEQANERIIAEDLDWWEVYDTAFIENARAHLTAAHEAVEGEPAKYRERIEFVQVGLDYTEALIEARELMQRVNASDGTDSEAKDAATEIWLERIKPLVHHEKYEHAIRDNNVWPGHNVSKDLAPEGLAEQWSR